MFPIRRVLAQSTNFLIHYEYETVYLTFKNSNQQDVIIGDFYGDPHTAYIADDESYCAVGGYGLIIYYLAPPFNPYFNGAKNKNWKELYREKEDTSGSKPFIPKISNRKYDSWLTCRMNFEREYTASTSKPLKLRNCSDGNRWSKNH
jgi:hypothetical protein